MSENKAKAVEDIHILLKTKIKDEHVGKIEFVNIQNMDNKSKTNSNFMYKSIIEELEHQTSYICSKEKDPIAVFVNEEDILDFDKCDFKREECHSKQNNVETKCIKKEPMYLTDENYENQYIPEDTKFDIEVKEELIFSMDNDDTKDKSETGNPIKSNIKDLIRNASNLENSMLLSVTDSSLDQSNCNRKYKKHEKRKVAAHITYNSRAEVNLCNTRIYEKSFSKMADLKLVTSVFKYICDKCGKTFPEESKLKTHFLQHVKKYECNECKKSFSQREGLKIHLLTHSGFKKYKCDDCSKCFSCLVYLKSHLLIHSSEKFECDTCGKLFSYPSNLLRHKKLHIGIKYACIHCNKALSQKCHLQNHLFLHSEVKKFECAECKKCYNQITSLKNHLLVHSGIKNHKCEFCGKSFIKANHLKRHSLIHLRKRVLK